MNELAQLLILALWLVVAFREIAAFHRSLVRVLPIARRIAAACREPDHREAVLRRAHWMPPQPAIGAAGLLILCSLFGSIWLRWLVWLALILSIFGVVRSLRSRHPLPWVATEGGGRFCAICEYDLRGTPESDRCPECGEHVPADLAQQYWNALSRP